MDPVGDYDKIMAVLVTIDEHGQFGYAIRLEIRERPF